ncbi:MAG: FAD binding domain-containing protein [Planctomycetota bacterium]
MRDELVFYVNGERHAVRGRAAGATLSDYLRDGSLHDSGLGNGGLREGCGMDGGCGASLTGTKIACAEGDCGACTVLVGEPIDGRLSYRSIDACIAFVYQMDGRHVVTVEGLADSGSLTPVQTAMVDCHGSQCGFCTPGFVMAMHGALEEHGATVDEETWRVELSGNLCRCTGYRQILDAAAQCAAAGYGGMCSRYDEAPIVDDLMSLDRSVRVNARASHESNGHTPTGADVFLPSTLDELLAARAERPEAKLVAGATDVGVQHNHGKINPTAVILTARVPELQRLEVIDGELVIGAAVDWSRIERFSESELPEYHQILTRFGSPQVRHTGTLVGNLANASPIADSLPFHYVAESTIELASVTGRREAPIESFYQGYKQLDLRPDEIIAAVRTPLPDAGVYHKLYKVSKRRDMDISTVTLGLWLRIDSDDTVTDARLAAGGVGPTVVRLPAAEGALLGVGFSLAAMEAAGREAADAITPITDVRGSDAYRRNVIENLFSKAWHDRQVDPAASVVT